MKTFLVMLSFIQICFKVFEWCLIACSKTLNQTQTVSNRDPKLDTIDNANIQGLTNFSLWLDFLGMNFMDPHGGLNQDVLL